jgi:hypothetical protein
LHTLIAVLLVVTCLFSLDVAHARKARFSITTKNTELKSVGLSIRLMYKGEEKALSPAPVYTYKNNRDDKLWNMFDPFDLWYRDQYICRWVDRANNSCVLAEITAPLPGPFRRKHVAKEEYDSAFERQENASHWGPKSLTKWVEDFTRLEHRSPLKEVRHKASIERLLEFDLKGPVVAYAFCMPESLHFKTKKRWFFVQFVLNPDTDKTKAKVEIAREFIATLRPVVVRGGENAGHSKKYQDKKFQGSDNRSKEFLVSRDRVISSIKNTEDWWYVETKNYILVANVPSSKRRLVKRMQSDIEYLRAAFEQFMPPMKAIDAISVVRTFAEPAEYLAYVGPKLKWSGGVWMPQRMELVIKPLERGRSGSVDRVLSVMYHEAFHQYIFYAFDHCAPAVWFNEGHATFFQNAAVTENRLRIGEDDRYIAEVSAILRSGGPDIKRMLAMSYADFYAATGSEKKRMQNYAVAWSIIYYLRKAAPLVYQNPYGYILKKYGTALWETKSGKKATDIAFEGIDLAKFKSDYTAFWKSSSKRSAAKRNQVFKEFRGWQSGK